MLPEGESYPLLLKGKVKARNDGNRQGGYVTVIKIRFSHLNT